MIRIPIIRGHWQKFNNELKVRKVKSEKDWVKYGITKKIDGKYLYITAEPCLPNWQGHSIKVDQNYK